MLLRFTPINRVQLFGRMMRDSKVYNGGVVTAIQRIRGTLSQHFYTSSSPRLGGPFFPCNIRYCFRAENNEAALYWLSPP